MAGTENLPEALLNTFEYIGGNAIRLLIFARRWQIKISDIPPPGASPNPSIRAQEGRHWPHGPRETMVYVAGGDESGTWTVCATLRKGKWKH